MFFSHEYWWPAKEDNFVNITGDQHRHNFSVLAKNRDFGQEDKLDFFFAKIWSKNRNIYF